MNFPTSAYLLALAAALLTSGLSLPVWRAVCLRCGLVDEPGPRKIHTAPMPLAGGCAVLSGLLLPLLGAVLILNFNLLGADAVEKLRYGLDRRAGQLGAILGGAVGMWLLGMLDDRHELRPGWKFAGQSLIAILVAVAGVRVTLFVPSLWFSYGVTVLWILTVTNAVNFMDNMNGLCAGLSAIAAGWFGWLAAEHGQYLVATMALLVCGAAAGFLPHNYPRARAFLGDAGSHLLGFLLAVLAILPHFYTAQHPQRHAVLTPLLVLAVPLADLVWVVWRRWRRGQPFYLGDTTHLSHRLAERGLSPARAVAVIWALGLAGGALAWWWQ